MATNEYFVRKDSDIDELKAKLEEINSSDEINVDKLSKKSFTDQYVDIKAQQNNKITKIQQAIHTDVPQSLQAHTYAMNVATNVLLVTNNATIKAFNELNEDPNVKYFCCPIDINQKTSPSVVIWNTYKTINNFVLSGLLACKLAAQKINDKYGKFGVLQDVMDDFYDKMIENNLNIIHTADKIYEQFTSVFTKQSDPSQIKDLFRQFNDLKDECQHDVEECEGKAKRILNGESLFISENQENSEITEDQATVFELKMSETMISKIVSECGVSDSNEKDNLKQNLLNAFLIEPKKNENDQEVVQVFDIKDFTTALFCAVDNAVKEFQDNYYNGNYKPHDLRKKLNNLDKTVNYLMTIVGKVYDQGQQRINKLIKREYVNSETREQVERKCINILNNLNDCVNKNISILNAIQNDPTLQKESTKHTTNVQRNITYTIRQLSAKRDRIIGKNNYKYNYFDQVNINNKNSFLNLDSNRATLAHNNYT